MNMDFYHGQAEDSVIGKSVKISGQNAG